MDYHLFQKDSQFVFSKRKLGGNDIRPSVSDLTQMIFEKYLLENPDDADIIIKNVF